ITDHLVPVVRYPAQEAPVSPYPGANREGQAKGPRTGRGNSGDHLVRRPFRGYRDEPGVAKDSYMATYAALRLYVDSWRWDGVPFYVRAGKALAKTVTEVIIELKRPPQCVFNEPTPARGNHIRMRVSPIVQI